MLQTFLTTTEPTRDALGDAHALGSAVVFSYSVLGEPAVFAPDVRAAMDQLDRQMARDFSRRHRRAADRNHGMVVRQCLTRRPGRARTTHRAARPAAKATSSDSDGEPPGDIAARAERAA